MNIRRVLIDSLNRQQLRADELNHVAAPNLEAIRSALGWEHALDACTERNLGICEVFWRPWVSLEPFAPRLPPVAARGYHTAIVTGHYHC